MLTPGLAGVRVELCLCGELVGSLWRAPWAQGRSGGPAWLLSRKVWAGAGLRWTWVQVLGADGQGLLQQCVFPVEMQLSPRVVCTHRRSLSLKMVYPKREKEKKGCGAWGRWGGPGPAQLSGQRFQDTDAWALAAGESGGRPPPTKRRWCPG